MDGTDPKVSTGHSQGDEDYPLEPSVVMRDDADPAAGVVESTRHAAVRLPWWMAALMAATSLGIVVCGLVLLLLRPFSPYYALLLLIGIALPLAGVRQVWPDSFDRQAENLRERVERDSGSRIVVNVQHNDGHLNMGTLVPDPATLRASDSLEKQEAILREIYTQGLTQAKRSFTVSLIFASIGALLLFLGVGLAIFHATTDGDQYASIVTAMAGVVTHLISSVFFVQSNRARASMGQQGVMLREESQDDRKLSAARELASTIDDPLLRDRVRAQLSLTLLEAPPLADPTAEEQGTADTPAAE